MTVNFWANDKLRASSRISRKKWQDNNKEHIRIKARERNQALKLEILSKYSDNVNCACCKEKELNFLSIDHIGGGGAAHRKEIGSGKLYIWLKKNGFPSGFRVLCFNCNHSYGHYNTCPHKDVLAKT